MTCQLSDVVYKKNRKKKSRNKRMIQKKLRNIVVRDMIIHCKANTGNGRQEERGGSKDTQKEFMKECE